MPSQAAPRARRTPGRSEDPAVLEEQLELGLEGSFPGSDAISVISTVIAGGPKPKIAGTDEHLRNRRRGVN